jgi:hypothetical protein
MPRGQKSKLRAREKRRQARDEQQSLKDTQAISAGGYISRSSHGSGDAVPSTSSAGLPHKSQGATSITTASVGGSHKKSGKGGRSQEAEGTHYSRAPHSTKSSQKELLLKKAGMLMQYLLYKYKMKEPIFKGEMLKIVNKSFKEHFPEILKKAAERMDLVFGLELKEVKPHGNTYTLMITGLGFPKNGLLMPLLGVIFLNDNCATEEEVWEFLNILGVYDGKTHTIFGDPRKLITQELVQERYLEYRQMRGSDPPRYEFLWGPRAHAETTKMKVLEFLAKVNDTEPSDFPAHYEEALRDEEERAKAKVPDRCGTTVKAKACARGTPGSSYCP